VGAVQAALEELTGIPVAEQLLLCGGARLEAAKALQTYGLPAGQGEPGKDVFLFNRVHLKPDAPAPPPEALPAFQPGVDALPMSSGPGGGHPLDDSPSPLLRTLPTYERGFHAAATDVTVLCATSVQQYEACQRLLAEQEVQALAIDSARENVDVHYAYISKLYTEFMARFEQLYQAHSGLLQSFEQDLSLLASIPLHPHIEASGLRTLSDLLPEAKLRSWAGQCAEGHKQYCGKVEELTGVFQALQRDVEALFMTLPSVDLQALGRQIDEGQAWVEELGTLSQSLRKDLDTVQKLVADTMAQLSAGGLTASRVQPLDAIAALDPMNEMHATLMPRAQELGAGVSRLVGYCLECKNAMCRSVHTQLKSISLVQSKIRDMRNKLAAFDEVFQAQQNAFGELRLARQIPAAYQACLAESIRRQSFASVFSQQVTTIAEKVAATLDQEASKRREFIQRYSSLLPGKLFDVMGLNAMPPVCEINLNQDQAGGIAVSLEDLRRLSDELPNLTTFLHEGDPARTGERPKSAGAASSAEMSHSGGSASDDSSLTRIRGTSAAGEESTEVQIARLKADLAANIAFMHALQLEPKGAPKGSGMLPGDKGGLATQEKLAAKTALALKQQDEFINTLQSRLKAALGQIDTYEHRLKELEAVPHAAIEGKDASTDAHLAPQDGQAHMLTSSIEANSEAEMERNIQKGPQSTIHDSAHN